MECTKYGPLDVLQLQEVAKPTPKDNEVLVKVHTTTVTASDCIVRSSKLPILYRIPMRIALGLRKPRKPILGLELAGAIEAIGKEVKRFQRGDQIFAFTFLSFGAHAEYTCLPEDGLLALKPANVTYEEAAAVPVGGKTRNHIARKHSLRTGHTYQL